MAWESDNPVVIGGATKASDFNVLFNNAGFERNATTGAIEATLKATFNAGIDAGGGVIAGDSVVTGLAAGTYTPSLTDTTNVAASVAFECQYMRVRNVVTVSGRVNIDVTATATNTVLNMSLPIASDFSVPRQCGGTGNPYDIDASGSITISSDSTTDDAEFRFKSGSSAANAEYFFSFTYLIV